MDLEPSYSPDYCVDILAFDYSRVPFVPDFIWASPPCEGFSVAVIGRNWNYDNTPKTPKAELAVKLVKKAIEIIEHYQAMNPGLKWVIENPRGKLRKMDFMRHIPFHNTVSYCQYGDKRMKPTDLWSNFDWRPRKMCKNGDPCHEKAPRGSRTGTQGLKGAYDRSMIPKELCQEILKAAQ